MSVFFITKHFMDCVFSNGVSLKVRMKNTVSSNSQDLKQQSRGENFKKLPYLVSTFSYFPKGLGVKVFNTRIYIKWSSS